MGEGRYALGEDALRDRKRVRVGTAAGAIGDGHEGRPLVAELLDGSSNRLERRGRLRRKHLEGNGGTL